MKRRAFVLMVILLASLAAAVPALAEVPLEGEVKEGESVPGVALGDTRAQVEAAYGQPYYCQVEAFPDDYAFCTFRGEGGGLVSVRYRGVDGGFAHNSADDKVIHIGWGEGTGGWTTTAGVSTTLAKNDPDAVVRAYPDAEVTRLSPNFIERVVDWLQGVEINWSYDSYTHQTHVSMSIFVPLPSLPTTQETHVETIELSAVRDHGIRKLRAWALILDEHGRAATTSSVDATWLLPNGSTQSAFEDFVGVDGVAFFEMHAPKGRAYRGVYTLRIDNVLYDHHAFNADDSVLTGSVYMK